MDDAALSEDPTVLRAKIAQLEAELATTPPIDRASLYVIADAVPIPLASLLPDGRVLFANRAMAATWLGGAGAGADFFAAAPPALADAVRPLFRSALGGCTVRASVRVADAHGRLRTLNLTAGPRRSGEAAGCMLVADDDTEAVEHEAAVAEAEARMRLALDGSGVGIYDLDLETGRGVWSDSAYAMLGLSPLTSDANFATWSGVIHPDDLAAVQAAHRAAAAAGGRWTMTYRILRADTGETRWLAVYGQVVRRQDRPARSVGAVVDVTEQRRAEALVRDSEWRLELAVRAHGIGVFDWDIPSGRVLLNRQEEEIMGLQPGELVTNIYEWGARLPPDELERMRTHIFSALASGQEETAIEHRLTLPDGGVRVIEGMARFFYDEQGRPARMIGTSKDITVRRLAEERQQLLINELNHRVKNTLAIVQNIARQTLSGDAAARAVRAAFEGRLGALSEAHNVLTRTNWDSASIRQMIDVVTAPYDPEGTRIGVDGPDAQLTPKAAVSLALAFHELATNAAKYGALSVAGGRIDIAWTLEAGRLRLSWRELGGPPVTPPASRGFGARLLERGLSAELGGKVSLAFDPAGVSCVIDAPLQAFDPPAHQEG